MGRFRTSFRLLVATAILALIPLGGFWSWKREGPLNHDRVFLVKRGSSVRQIASALEAEGIIRSAHLFTLWARTKKLKLVRGEYVFRAGASLSEVAGKLRKGDYRDTIITVTPGMSAWSLQRRLRNYVPESVFWQLWKSPTLTRSAGFGDAENLEGLIAPASYHINRALEPEEILLMMVEKFRETVRPRLNGGELSPYDTLILASLTEKETRIPAELPRVAGVYTKRLQIGMRLQCDPTSLYARWLSGNLSTAPPNGDDIRRPHRFNTYTSPGLPPTPITIPSTAAIEAAKSPLISRDIFFVATGRGGHAFAPNLKEHNKNVSNFRKEIKRRQQLKEEAKLEEEEIS